MRHGLTRAIRPASSREITRDHLRIKFHESTGANVAFTGRINGSAFSGTLELAGTPTNLWNTRGQIQPAGDNGILVSDANFIAATRVPAGGGMMILGTTGYADANGVSARWLQRGLMNNTGGWSITQTTAALQVQAYAIGGAAIKTAGKNIASRAGERIPFLGYLNFSTGNIYNSIDGNWAANSSGTLDGAAPHDLSALTGVSLLANHGSGPALAAMINSSSGTMRLGDLILIHDPDLSLFADIGTIATQHAYAPLEIPRGIF